MSTTDVLNPATEEVITTLELHDESSTDAAIDRAVSAQRQWREVTDADRARLLRRFATVVQDHNEELAQLEVNNAGHTVGNARWEAQNVADVLQYYAAAPERHVGKQIPVSGGMVATFHEPIGVIGVIVPWNFPMPIAGWAIGPALAAGNAVVLKPAELTPLTALRLAELALAAGLPQDLFQVVPGKGSVVGSRFVTHPQVGKVVFTGSTEVGRAVMAGCAEQVKPVTLELGGKNANVIFADADLAAAAVAAPAGAYDNAGQDCCARSRLLVQRDVLDDFLAELTEAVRNVIVDHPTNTDALMGPLISASQRDTVAAYVRDADVLAQAPCPSGPGFWSPATLIAARDTRDPTFTDEIFGPVISVLPFDTEAEAIALANDTAYGLAGSIWTRDLGRALRVSRAVQAGNISVNSHSSVRYNTPFGGFKQSGLGRELGPDALDAFTELKTVFFSSH